MAYENLLVERQDGVMVVTINRPKVLNALNAQTLIELSEVIEEAGREDEVRVVVLTGAGDRSFVAGADINELAVQSPVGGREHARRGQTIFDRIEHLGKPVIAAVNGFALGGGCELAMACTMRLAADTAKFGQPEINLGLIPGYGGTQRLPRLVGRGRALELLLAGDPISADDAFRIGLVNRVVAATDFERELDATVQKLLALPPASVRASKRLTARAFDLSFDDFRREMQAEFKICLDSEEHRAAMEAIRSRRSATRS